MLAGGLLLGPREAEPGLALAALVVVGYGLSERLLPGLLHFARSVSAEGRLEQPLTYWNGMGVVAAFGVVLCARLVADTARPSWLRAAAAAASAPLGLGLALTVSRGALFACVAGLLTLLVAARRREQLAAILLVVAAGGLATVAAAPFGSVTELDGRSAGAGAFVLVALVVTAALAAVGVRFVATGPLHLPRRSGLIALAVVVAGFAVALAAGTDERALAPGAERLATLQSNRYEYWRVAGRAFGDEPLHGVGAAGWAVRWRMERPFGEQARDAHSLYFETAAELGIVGLLLLGAWLGGVALAARAGLTAAPGLVAVCAVWAAHVSLDWDFDLPATTVPAALAAGALLAYSASATRGASRRNTTAATTQTAT